MKKVLLSVFLIVFTMSFVACGSYDIDDIQKPSDVSIGDDNEEKSQQKEQTEQQNVQTDEETDQPEQTEQLETSITETVLIDESGIKITAKSFSTDELFGPSIKLLIENESGQDLTFQCRNASVNGYMVETMMSVDVVNGKKANDNLTFMKSDLDICGISDIADMEFSFHVFNSEDWENYLDTEPIQIKTSISDDYEYVYDDSGHLAYEGNGTRVIVKGLAEDGSIFGPSIVVYIENNSEKNITVQTRDVSINGFMVEAIFSSDVSIGKRAVDMITFMESDLEENEITAIENVELSFHIFESDGWDTIVDTEVVTITF